MNVAYNSPHYQVVEYPGMNAYEVINRVTGLGTFIQGELATAFRQQLASRVAQNPSVDAVLESVDEFLENFDALMRQPAVYH